jgi:putative transposase
LPVQCIAGSVPCLVPGQRRFAANDRPIPLELWLHSSKRTLWRRGRPTALLHHSDQGSQYQSEAFQRLLGALGITCSMSRSGDVWDNSAMESFFSSLKTERVNRRVYATRDEARADVFDYVERFYNRRRQHSTLG